MQQTHKNTKTRHDLLQNIARKKRKENEEQIKSTKKHPSFGKRKMGTLNFEQKIKKVKTQVHKTHSWSTIKLINQKRQNTRNFLPTK